MATYYDKLAIVEASWQHLRRSTFRGKRKEKGKKNGRLSSELERIF